MRTPKEICKEVTGTRPMPMDDIYKAMSIYGKEIAIRFADWADSNYFGLGLCLWGINIGEDDEQRFTTEQLFQIYLQTL